MKKEKETMPKTQSVRISEDLHKELRMIAADRHVHIAEIAQQFLLDAVCAHRKKQ